MGMQLACFVLVVIGGSSAVEPSQRWVWVLAYSLVLPSYLLQVVVKRFGILPYDLPRPPPLDLEHYVERVGLFMISACTPWAARARRSAPLTRRAVRQSCWARPSTASR